MNIHQVKRNLEYNISAVNLETHKGNCPNLRRKFVNNGYFWVYGVFVL